MQLPTIPKLDRLAKTHRYSAAGIAAAGVGVLAITGVAGTSGTAQASGNAQEAAAGQARSAAAKQHAAHAAQQAVERKREAAERGRQAEEREQRAAARKRRAAHVAQQARVRHEEQQAANRSRERKALVPQQRHETSRPAPRAAAPKAPAAPAAPSGTPQQMAQQIIGDAAQFQCFANIVMHESTWNPYAVNPSSGAYGLVQALPGSKMASAGADWRTNPATQIKWGLGYMNERYGSPCGAWAFWQANHWY
ncbi:transglycosylase SLT domain-containing protein [Streptomyces sp. NPDC026673]|uniref:aggregation-promoting factor C-terminal-like domain-containing protein n=1 Tax=Streptomyces sp. NPDC026673 TaxID=3155724 RepID=UPI0033DBADD8